MCLILFIYSKNLLKMSKNFKSTKGQKVACSQCGWHGHRASMSMHWQDAHRAKMDQFKSKQRWVPISNSTKLEIKCKHYIIIFWLNIIIVCTVETYKSWQGKSLQNFKLLRFFGSIFDSTHLTLQIWLCVDLTFLFFIAISSQITAFKKINK